MLRTVVHWGLPAALSLSLMTFTHAPLARARAYKTASPKTSQVGKTSSTQVPLYPDSHKSSTPNTISSPFSLPLLWGGDNHLSGVWQVAASYHQVENWYIRNMQNEGYHLISHVLSSASHSESMTHGLLFSQGVQGSNQVGINILPLSSSVTDYQYLTARVAVPKRPAASLVPSVSAVRSIEVAYRPWRYGSPVQSYLLTRPMQIAPVIKILNGLPVMSPAVYHCVADFGQGAVLTVHFRNGHQWVIKENAACESVQIPHSPGLFDVNLNLYHLLAKDSHFRS